ncbi:MAG: adenosylcobinamide-GDP ribazoletransferase [Firmicutes bacterium]|nr:adenosylcobinamide-GDP ribazoletransferase [Bacillota bacterium]
MKAGVCRAAHDAALALKLLTRFPVPVATATTEERLAGACAFFPLVGAVVGAVLAAGHYALSPIVPPLLVASLTVASWELVTGGMHLDGLMDSADGILSGGGRERALEIMRDGRVGAMAVAVAIIVLLVKFAAVASLEGADALRGLLLAPVAGRTNMVVCLGLFPYARPEGMGSFARRVGAPHLVASSLAAVLAAGAVAGPMGVALLVGSAGATYAFCRRVSGLLGGLTGDTYGAACELSEATILVLWTMLRDGWSLWLRF